MLPCRHVSDASGGQRELGRIPTACVGELNIGWANPMSRAQTLMTTASDGITASPACFAALLPFFPSSCPFSAQIPTASDRLAGDRMQERLIRGRRWWQRSEAKTHATGWAGDAKGRRGDARRDSEAPGGAVIKPPRKAAGTPRRHGRDPDSRPLRAQSALSCRLGRDRRLTPPTRHRESRAPRGKSWVDSVCTAEERAAGWQLGGRGRVNNRIVSHTHTGG